MHTVGRLTEDLRVLGLRPGDLVMVHASMRAVGPVLGGPDAVIDALLSATAPDGTVAAYVDWNDGAQGRTRADRGSPLDPELREAWPAFDPATARADRSYGVLPEFLRTRPGAHRSANPGASVAAVGSRARWLCADHALHYGYGPGSPLARVVEGDGRVLLLGSPLENVTLLHHAEHVARLPGKRVIRYEEKILVDGEAAWVWFEEFDTGDPVVDAAPEDHFERLMRAYLEETGAQPGRVGGARTYLIDAEPLHRFAVAWLEQRYGRES